MRWRMRKLFSLLVSLLVLIVLMRAFDVLASGKLSCLVLTVDGREHTLCVGGR